jgi:regulator of PEP synthase PpsR (kinase-PPPase family)
VDKAHQAVRQINHVAEVEGKSPSSSPPWSIRKCWNDPERCKGMLLDMFGTFVRPLEVELGRSRCTAWAASRRQPSKEYTDRMEAINYTLAHDDGQTNRDLAAPT